LKTRILAPRQVLAQVDQVLARKLSLHDVARRKPLEDVGEALSQARRYPWVGIHLQAGSVSVPQISRGAESSHAGKSQIAVPIKIASRVLGALEVASDRENAFGYGDRVLLKQVAARLARFLTSTGKVLLRHERERQNVAPLTAAETRGYQPASQKAASLRAAAGENRRS
jgi:hypothetical protein